jgi:hypothetical protein
MFVSSAARQLSSDALATTTAKKPTVNKTTEKTNHQPNVEDLMQTMTTNHPDLIITTELSE